MDKRGDPGGNNNRRNDFSWNRHFATRDGTGHDERIFSDESFRALVTEQLNQLFPETHHLHRAIFGRNVPAQMSDDERRRLLLAILEEVQNITRDDNDDDPSSAEQEDVQDDQHEQGQNEETQGGTNTDSDGNQNSSSDEGGLADDPPSR